MFRTEFYRIFSRKTALAGMLIVIFFVLFLYGGSSFQDEGVIDNGKVYRGREAVARDKEIAAEFSGPLTADTVRAIWEKYGSPVNYTDRDTGTEYMNRLAAGGGSDNFCNRLVARLFCRAEEEDGKIVYVLREDLEEIRYLKEDHVFGYVGEGWYWYWDKFFVCYILVGLVIIVALSPTFSEDYACRVADMALPTVRGRFPLWMTRTLAGGIFASLFYWLITGLLFVQQLLLYGGEGLLVSSDLTGNLMFWEHQEAPVWMALLYLYLFGWLAVILHAFMVQSVSALCRKSFSSLMWSLILYAGPFALARVVLSQFPRVFLNALLQEIMHCMPLSYVGVVMDTSLRGKFIVTGILLTVALLFTLRGAVGWCRHQIRN